MNEMLKVLNCPLPIPYDITSAKLIVCWLEDCKIRSLEEHQRQVLSQAGSDDIWLNELSVYLSSLHCPIPLSVVSVLTCVSWLISFAISLEYEDCREQGINALNENEMEISAAEETSSLQSRLDEVGNQLALVRISGEDDVQYLQRLSQRTRLYLKEGSVSSLECAASGGASRFSLSDFPLGFDTGDQSVNDVCLVLRMMYLYDLRELQHDLNTLLVMGQEYTANP
jgi:hypothetical protein